MWVADPRDPQAPLRQALHGSTSARASASSPRRRPIAAAATSTTRLGRGHSRSLLTLGLSERPWEDRPTTGLRGVGDVRGRRLRPGRWKPSIPGPTCPLRIADRIDKFWASKIVIRFTREQIRAAVDAREANRSAARRVPRRDASRAPAHRPRSIGSSASIHSTSSRRPANACALTISRSGTRLTSADDAIHAELLRFRRASARQAGGDRRRRRRRQAARRSRSRDQPGYTIVRVDTTRPGFTGTRMSTSRAIG